ncbi:hypothetical protein [Bdellovibrio bacteriovorus]|nr:hypothetical protein [Bdellovibrio bacteriovorus]
MSKKLLGLILGYVTVSSIAYAGDFRDAGAICSTLDFDSKKSECAAMVRSYQSEYFDTKAINVCNNLDFDSKKLLCISVIADKTYEAFEINQCRDESVDSRKISCLAATGSKYRDRRPEPYPSYPSRPSQPPRPSHPSHPSRPNQSSQDYVVGQTQRWINAGTFIPPKAVVERIVISVNSREAVKEIRLATERSGVRILRASGVTASGYSIQLGQLVGSVGANANRSFALDPRYAIRLQRIELEVTSTGLVGSRGRLEVLLGVTR